jgi:hypothetical protein
MTIICYFDLKTETEKSDKHMMIKRLITASVPFGYTLVDRGGRRLFQ